jgi:disulfide bond formation protein DsbB
MDGLIGNRRAVTGGLALFCFALVGYALYAQAYQGFNPCPLCIFQRIGLTALGVALLVAALLPARPAALRRLGSLLVLIAAAGTAGVAIRHLYIQHLPDGMVPVCGASLDYMLDAFPLTDVLRKVLTGSGECHKVDWTFLGLAMPAWVLIWSTLVGVAGFWANWRRPAR